MISARSASAPIFTAQNVRTRILGPLNGAGNLSGRIPVPAPGTPAFTFDSDGNFQTGVANRDNSNGQLVG